MVWVLFNRQLSILPGRFQPSTFDVWGLNYCVRDGNRWILVAIVTEFVRLHVRHALKTAYKIDFLLHTFSFFSSFFI